MPNPLSVVSQSCGVEMDSSPDGLDANTCHWQNAECPANCNLAPETISESAN